MASDRELAVTPRGRLRVFLGAARGVGKTFAMLQAAQTQAEAGERVVLGWVDLHARRELQPLAANLVTIPPRRTQSHGAWLQELDLDAVLAAHPTLVVIDDLAHTNAPGARHPQRYLDVLEILAAGINVYTTLNIQHLESLNDSVARLTGLRERETVPDSLLEQAEITVVDLAPAQLVQRLENGQVFVPLKEVEQVRALYRLDKLSALRELALRYKADHMDAPPRAEARPGAPQDSLPPRERVMVCLAADDLAERLVRTAWQTAASLGVEWVAVHIQTPRDNRANPTEKQVLERSLSLAAAQGAQVVALSGEDVGTELLTYAHAHNITNIVVGKHLSRPWRRVLHGALADELVRGSDGIHVLLVTSEEQSANVRLWDIELGRHPVRGYLGSVGAVVAATLVGLAVRPFLAPTNIALVYLLAVVLSATFWGMGPAIFSAVAAVVTFDILFVPPYGTLAVHDSQYFLTFVIFLIVGILISELGSRLRAQVDAARQRERETAALYALSTSMTRDTSSSLDAALQQLNSLFDAQAVLLRAESGETLTAYPPTNLPEIEKQAARWAFEHNEAAGHGTLNLAGAERLYLPLQSAQRMLGVLSVRPEARQRGVQSQRLLETFAGQVAIALEHARLSEQAEQARLLEASERFRNALLSSLSHDLRTPLASILGAATGLLDETAELSPATRRDLVETIHEEARRLNRYVGNLLNMTRLESGTLKPQREWHSIEEVIGSALAHAGLNGHPVRLEIDPALPLIPFDFVLIDQVLVNLLDNAAKFSPASAPIEITAEVQAQTLEVTVSDRGTTVPRTELDRIFEKFYRVSQGQRTVGMGLGLSIAKGIVEAHDGTVFARPRAAGGMEIGFRLPARVQGTAV